MIDFLSHCTLAQGVVPLTSKVQAVAEFPRPEFVKVLQEFLGMTIFITISSLAMRTSFSHCMESCGLKRQKTLLTRLQSNVSRPLTELRCPGEHCHSRPSHTHGAHSFISDASDIAPGEVVEWHVMNPSHQLAFFGRQLRDNEHKYSVFDRRLLAMHLATRLFYFQLEAGSRKAGLQGLNLWTFGLLDFRHVQRDPWSARQQHYLAAISQRTFSIWPGSPILLS